MRPEKQQLVADLRRLIEPCSGIFLISYKGLTVSQFAEFRSSLVEYGAECHVVPNRLLLRAAAECGLDELAGLALEEDNAIVTGGSDVVAIAKKVREFAKKHDAVAIKHGVLDGALISGQQVSDLADLPPREVLLAQLLGVLVAPAQQLVGVLNAKSASVVYALKAYLDKKEQAA